MADPEPQSRSEPAITATVRAYVHARLTAGVPARVVREAAIAAFVEPFAEDVPIKEFVAPYRNQIAGAVDAAIAGFPGSPDGARDVRDEIVPTLLPALLSLTGAEGTAKT
jgi:hypothetical protein